MDVSHIGTSTRVLGQDLQWPLLCSPTGASRLYHPDGELAVARAAAEAGVYDGVSVAAIHSLEEITAASSGPKFFQLLGFKNRDLTRDLIERCRAARYPALCVTVDAAALGKRERALRSGMDVPPKLTLASLADLGCIPGISPAISGTGLARVGWCCPTWSSAAAPSRGATGQQLIRQLDPAATWADVRDIADRWRGPPAVKGILSAAAAR